MLLQFSPQLTVFNIQTSNLTNEDISTITYITILTSFLRCAVSASSGVVLVTDNLPVVLNFS